MFKYFCILLLCSLLQVKGEAAPVNEGIEQLIIDFIANHADEIAEIKQIIEDLIQHEKEHRDVENSLDNMKNEMLLASNNGDICAQQLLGKITKDIPDCPSADDLVQAAGKIVSATTDILTGSVHTIYTIFFSEKLCPGLSGFRCFLSRFHQAQGAVFKVLDNVTEYNTNIKELIKVYKTYFGECKAKKQVQLQTNMELYKTCNNQNLKLYRPKM